MLSFIYNKDICGCLAPEVPLFRGMPMGLKVFFGAAGSIWATALRLVPIITKALYHTSGAWQIPVCSRSSKTYVVFTKTKMNNKWSINFLQNSTLIPMNFPLVGALLKILFWYGMKLVFYFFNILHILISSLEIKFQFRKQEKVAQK